MYQQQNHPIDDMLREHIHGMPTPRPTKKLKTKRVLKQKIQKPSKYGYSYNIDGTYQ